MINSNSQIFIRARRTQYPAKTASSRVWNRLLGLAEKLNVPVILTNLIDCGAEGFSVKYNGRIFIAIESNLSKRKRNVVLAHELGHIQKRHLDIANFALYKIDHNYSSKFEREAERFCQKLIRLIERRNRSEAFSDNNPGNECA